MIQQIGERVGGMAAAAVDGGAANRIRHMQKSGFRERFLFTYIHTYMHTRIRMPCWVGGCSSSGPTSQPSWQSDDKDDEEEKDDDGAAGEQGRRVINPVR